MSSCFAFLNRPTRLEAWTLQKLTALETYCHTRIRRGSFSKPLFALALLHASALAAALLCTASAWRFVNIPASAIGTGLLWPRALAACTPPRIFLSPVPISAMPLRLFYTAGGFSGRGGSKHAARALARCRWPLCCLLRL